MPVVHSLAALELAVVSAVVDIVMVVALVVAHKLVVRHILALEPVVVVLDNRLEQVVRRMDMDFAFRSQQQPVVVVAYFPASL